LEKLDNAIIRQVQRFEVLAGAVQTDNPATSLAGAPEMKHIGLAAPQGQLTFGLPMSDRIYICSAI
jgi:hypothetical protein